MGLLEGCRAIVTGGASGIGAATCRRFVEEGACVVITARNLGPLAEAAEGLGGPDRALAVAGKADDQVHQAEAREKPLDRFFVLGTRDNCHEGRPKDHSPEQCVLKDSCGRHGELREQVTN